MERFMRLGVLAAVIAAAISKTASAENIVVYYRGGQKMVDGFMLNTSTVCDLKTRVSKAIGLPGGAFDLQYKHETIAGTKPLSAFDIRNGGAMQVKEVAESSQC